MQSMWSHTKRHKFNALVILLTLILRDRFSTVFALTMNQIDTSSLLTYDFNSAEVHTKGNFIEKSDITPIDRIYEFNDINDNQLFPAYKPYAFVSNKMF